MCYFPKGPELMFSKIYGSNNQFECAQYNCY